MSAGSGRGALERVSALLDAKRPEEALDLLAGASDPEDERAQCLMSLALTELDRHAEALAAADRAAALSPEEEWGHRLRAVALLALGRPKQAAAAASEAIRLEPELAEPHMVLAQAQAERDRLPAARKSALKAAELAPEKPDTHRILGDIALKAKDPAAAEGCYRTALRGDPENAIALNNLGIALLRQRRRTEANEAFTSAARLDPRQGESTHNVAVVAREFITSGGWAVAIAAFAVLQIVRIAIREESGLVAAAVVVGSILAAVAGLVLFQRLRERQLSPRERALLADQRARLWRRPWQWRPQRIFLPWPIWILVHIPAPIVLAATLGAVALMLASSGGYGAGDWAVFAAVTAIAIGSAFRTRRLWLRRQWR